MQTNGALQVLHIASFGDGRFGRKKAADDDGDDDDAEVGVPETSQTKYRTFDNRH